MATLYYRPQALETIARPKNFMGEEKSGGCPGSRRPLFVCFCGRATDSGIVGADSDRNRAGDCGQCLADHLPVVEKKENRGDLVGVACRDHDFRWRYHLFRQ